LRDDWLVFDRIIDAPVSQATLIWDKLSQAVMAYKVKYLGA